MVLLDRVWAGGGEVRSGIVDKIRLLFCLYFHDAWKAEGENIMEEAVLCHPLRARFCTVKSRVYACGLALLPLA